MRACTHHHERPLSSSCHPDHMRSACCSHRVPRNRCIGCETLLCCCLHSDERRLDTTQRSRRSQCWHGINAVLLSYFPFVHKNLKLVFIVTIFRLTNNFNTLPGMVFVLFFVWPFEYCSRKCCACIEESNENRGSALYWLGILWKKYQKYFRLTGLWQLCQIYERRSTDNLGHP